MRYLLTIFIVATLVSCTRTKHPVNQINRIEFARSGAWQDWGAAISIDSTLTYKYYGGKGRDRHYYIGKISPAFWDTLNSKLEGMKFTQIPSTDSAMVADAHYFELIIHWKGQKRRIDRVWDEKPDSVLTVFKWINESYRTIKLQ